MRDIKFRVWEKDSEEMVEWYDIKELDKSLLPIVNMIESDDYVFMQFTGLYDHYSNPIYEGDIVKGTSRLDENWSPLQKVHFHNGCFMFGNWNAHEYFNKHTEIEVIGNVYEDEDLMK